MKNIVIYDSYFDNTKRIAEAIAGKLEGTAINISDVKKSDMEEADFIVVGTPIRGWMPSDKTKAFLSALISGELKNKKVAAFDTRVDKFYHGDAMKKIANSLKKAGGELKGYKAFIVEGTEGPLREGEIEKAAKWAEELKQSL